MFSQHGTGIQKTKLFNAENERPGHHKRSGRSDITSLSDRLTVIISMSVKTQANAWSRAITIDCQLTSFNRRAQSDKGRVIRELSLREQFAGRRRSPLSLMPTYNGGALTIFEISRSTVDDIMSGDGNSKVQQLSGLPTYTDV